MYKKCNKHTKPMTKTSKNDKNMFEQQMQQKHTTNVKTIYKQQNVQTIKKTYPTNDKHIKK